MKKNNPKSFQVIPVFMAIFGGINLMSSSMDPGAGSLFNLLVGVPLLFISGGLSILTFLRAIILKKKITKFSRNVSILTLLIVIFSIIITVWSK